MEIPFWLWKTMAGLAASVIVIILRRLNALKPAGILLAVCFAFGLGELYGWQDAIGRDAVKEILDRKMLTGGSQTQGHMPSGRYAWTPDRGLTPLPAGVRSIEMIEEPADGLPADVKAGEEYVCTPR